MVSNKFANTAIAVRACAVLLTLSFGAAHAAPFAYITNSGSNNVSVIDTANNTVVATVPVGINPYGVAVNAAGTRVYAANFSGGNVSVINTATNTVIATVTVGTNPNSIAVNPAGTRAYVPNRASNTLSVIDTTNNTLITNLPVGPAPYGVAVNPAGTRAYVSHLNDNRVYVIDTSNNTILTTILVGTTPAGVAVNSAGTRVYVTNFNGGSVSVINTATNTVVATITVGASSPFGVTLNPSGTRAYVGNYNSNNVSVIDTANNTVLGNVPVGSRPIGVAVNPADTRWFVANEGNNNVRVFSTATNALLAIVGVGSAPSALGVFMGPFPPQPPADNNPRKPGGYIANGAANCRGAIDSDRMLLVAEPTGLHNSSLTLSATVVCNQAADEFARTSGNATPLTAGIASYHIVFRNRGSAAQTVNCTGTAGRATTVQSVRPKSVLVPAGARAGIDWTVDGDNSGVPFQRPTDITCVLPPEVQINETFNRFFREVGDFTPVP